MAAPPTRSAHTGSKLPKKATQTLIATSIGYKLQEQGIAISGGSVTADFSLKEEPNELKAVVVSAGTFEASDTKRTTVLNPIDIVTTASANADVTGAIRTLPGTQQVGEEKVFSCGAAPRRKPRSSSTVRW